MLQLSEVLQRAKLAQRKKVKYKMGSGPPSPESLLPKGSDGACDCSAFSCWLIKRLKQTTEEVYKKFNDGWLNTDAIYNDAKKHGKLFIQLPKPKIGCFSLFPANSTGHLVGHIALVTACHEETLDKIVHCSSGNYSKYGDAIMETTAEVFDIPETIFVWYNDLVV